MRQKVSAYIIAYNEEKNIAGAVKSVLWADEVLVVDSFSTDQTVSIASELGAKVVQVPFEGFGKLRESAIAATEHDWIFSLDTDERCTPEAREEIFTILSKEDARDAYYVPRRNLFMGREIKFSGWSPDYRQPQLFRRNALKFSNDLVHEVFEVNGTIGYLKSSIWQIPFKNLSQQISKMERYSTLGAGKLAARGKHASMSGALLHGTAAFCRHYIFKLGFLDGWAGFVIALGNFEGTFYRYAKKVEADRNWSEAENKLKGIIIQ